jgi:hypothetical protein
MWKEKMKNEILLFWHCAKCVSEKPAHKSPREYASIEAGWTKKGFQAWCKKCEMNIINLDLLGNKVAIRGAEEQKNDDA